MPDTPQMPALPPPDTHCYDQDTGKDVWSHSADQMCAYANEHAAQQVREALERAAQLCDDQSSIEGIAQRCRDAIRALAAEIQPPQKADSA